MRLRTPGPAIGLVLVLGSAAGCGGEEMFTLELGANERMIGTAATARLASPDRGLQEPIVVGDLDGDGVDDAIVRSSFASPGPDGETVFGGAVYVLYGGSGVTGSIDLASLPALTHIGPYVLGIPPVAGVAAVGDVDGDGLADFAVSIAPCLDATLRGLRGSATSPTVGGAYLVYSSATRLTGSHAIGEVAALLNDPVTCQPDRAHRRAGAAAARLRDPGGESRRGLLGLAGRPGRRAAGVLRTQRGRSARRRPAAGPATVGAPRALGRPDRRGHDGGHDVRHGGRAVGVIGGTQVRPWLGPAVDLAVDLEVTPRASLRAGIELGVVATGATGRDLGQPVAAIAGAWTSLGLAAVIEL